MKKKVSIVEGPLLNHTCTLTLPAYSNPVDTTCCASHKKCSVLLWERLIQMTEKNLQLIISFGNIAKLMDLLSQTKLLCTINKFCIKYCLDYICCPVKEY